jgi:phosphatidylglycerophosphatase A
VGFTPRAPGSAASLLTALLLWLVPFSSLALGATLVGVTLAGIWAGGRVERRYGRKDPGVIVIDEVAGTMLAVWTLPRTPPVLIAAFFCFRVLDIVKPFPCRQAQALPGGWGIVADDLAAGALTLALLRGSGAAFGWP